jgi:ankyrin repeat protein
MAATMNGHLEMLWLLLARGAAVDAAEPIADFTAFHFACQCKRAECAEALALAGCDVSLKTINGKTGRQLAKAEGHAGVLERLRLVVANQLRAALAAESEPEPEPAEAGGVAPAELCAAAQKGDVLAVRRLLALYTNIYTLCPRSFAEFQILAEI